jgi:hypothetical protein
MPREACMRLVNSNTPSLPASARFSWTSIGTRMGTEGVVGQHTRQGVAAVRRDVGRGARRAAVGAQAGQRQAVTWWW